MTTQLTFFSPVPRARRTDPRTSHDAAKMASVNAETSRAKALIALYHAKDLTDFELEDITGIKQTSIGKRRGDLVKLGYVEGSGSVRPAPSGANATVWRITEQGRIEAMRLVK